ncbi:lauroyl acyltransferase [Hymenobacter sp. UV11]|uniref:lysophospholipid acyltransferase family protein n=1 Tax=Hymenobacter sp. UV11 TaxID=1849735 RepID=UPI00105ED952|nr:lauroyl acyltransferase [Hymenobacter sp. UV11]TDN38280.1 lauroyl acyltransferase [Hymenobacter sp. UV11]TFZ67535.1 lauroyl acyltransferase [Hymenobacter sp. UV11]
MSTTPAVPWYYRVLSWPLLTLAHLPLVVLYGFAKSLYWLLAYVVRYRQQVVLDNLRHAFPEKSAAEIQHVARQFYWHFAQVMVEILKLASINAAELQRRVHFTNPELLGGYLAQGRQVLGVGSHMGNWEWVLAGAAVRFPGQVAGVYKPLGNKFFEYYVRRLRMRLGAEVVPMLSTLRYLVAHRGQGQILSLVSDQAAGPDDRPYWTDFLHRPAGFYTSVDRLTPQFAAVVLCARTRRVKRGYYTVTFTELPGDAATTSLPPDAAHYPIIASFVQLLAADIGAAPEQYLWTHRRWKHKR